MFQFNLVFKCTLICFGLVQFVHLALSVEIECIPLKLCPMALKIMERNKYAPETIEFLRFSHCGYTDEHEPKVWCNKFKFCKTPDDKNGTCIHIKRCNPLLQILRNVDTTSAIIKTYMNDFRCNTIYDKEVHVCCPDDDATVTDNTVIPEKRFHQPLPNPKLQECGVQSTEYNKIFGGTEVELSEYPWTSLLQYDSKKGLKYGCGGSLINARYVVTAAHCLDDFVLSRKGLGKLRQVVLGEYDIRNETDCIYFKYGKDCADPPVHYEVQSTILHENYNITSTKNDIGLIRLTREVVYSDYIKPICLPKNPVVLNGNESFVITGWGKTESLSMSPVKRKAVIKYSESNKCDDLSRYALSNGQICVGNGSGVDSCYGDSGGPLMLEKVTGSQFVTYLYGIISYGFRPCGVAPSVYTYIPNYVDWIVENIR